MSVTSTFECYDAYIVDFEAYVSEVHTSDHAPFRVWCAQALGDAVKVPPTLSGTASWRVIYHDAPRRALDILAILNGSIAKHSWRLPTHDMGSSPLPYARLYPMEKATGRPMHGYQRYFTTKGAMQSFHFWVLEVRFQQCSRIF